MNRYTERVLAEARRVAAEDSDGPLAAALAYYDQFANEAMRAVERWLRISRPPNRAMDPLELPPSREGSLSFVPTAEQASIDPLLAACHAAEMTESQVIELQFRRTQELLEQLMRYAELASPRLVVMTGERQPTEPTR